ncbi:MAG: hypothetical protein ACJ77B_09615 [Chloroflexota bacterium]
MLALRRIAAALALGLVAVTSGVAAGGVAHASAATAPKVVVIVGPTGSQTADYRTGANAAAAEALKYTPNVVKVYSPNATWTAVKAATAGASIVVYLGHGNGWPSPYTFDPAYNTKDGFGLNATANSGDSNVKYYGEPYVSTLDLAPNAVVLLNRLCYASGNSEPGLTAPTLSIAKQRADNFGAGFLKGKAEAVIADGHISSMAYYIRALFTSHTTLDASWRAAPNFHNHAFAFASVRSAGNTVEMDPDNATSGYYRSIVGQIDLSTDSVVGIAASAFTQRVAPIGIRTR